MNANFWSAVKKYRSLTEGKNIAVKPTKDEIPFTPMTSYAFGKQFRTLNMDISESDLLFMFEQAQLSDRNLKDFLYGYYNI